MLLGQSLTLSVAMLSVGLLGAAVHAEPPAPKGDPAFWSDEHQGLMAMRNADYPAAIKAFGEALKRTPDPNVHLQRGVAYALQGDFDAAYEDLDRARIPNSREPELWKTCIWAMSGKPPAAVAGNRGQDWFSGIPGHLVQGGKDYDTAYASCVAYELATQYEHAREARGDLHAPAIVAATHKAGRWFANRNLATAPMASFSLQSARQLLEKNQLPEALEAAGLARTIFPFDGDIRFVSAEIYRRLGRPETARVEYTIALTMATDSAAAYRGRALAAAAEGDRHRAEADLASAAKFDPNPSADISQSVRTLLSHASVTDTPANLLGKLDAAAAAGDPADKLLPVAMELQKASAATRLRYDEIYQDRLHQLEDAMRASPQNADAYVAVAGYILDELSNRGEEVEPRRAMQPYRYQYSQAMEVSRAMFALNKALNIDPHNVEALVRMAYANDAIGQSDKAAAYIQQVMQLVGTANADAVRLLAEYRARQAGRLFAQAQSLRTPTFTSSSHTENRSDGVYLVTVTTRHDPSGYDLQQADACEQQAKQVIAQAKSLMEQAMKQNPDTVDGLLLRASYENWFATPEQALATLRKAAEKFPASLKAQDALVDYLQVHLMADDAIDQRMVASKLYQTTAGPLLERVWRKIHDTGWEPLVDDLKRARQADPADARSTAYLAFAQSDAKQDAQSAASLRVATALEVARLQFDEQGAGAQLPRDAGDFALPIRLLDLSAVRAAKSNQLDKALDDCRTAAGFGQRFAPGGNGEMMYGAMIPDPHADPFPAPAPVNGATLAATANVDAGEMLKRLGRLPDAMAYFRAAAMLAQATRPAGAPKVGNARGDTNFSDEASGPAVVTAFIEIAQWHIDHGDDKAAAAALQAAGECHPDRSQTEQLNRMMMQVAQRINSRPRP